MVIRDRLIALIYRIVILALGVWTLTVQLTNNAVNNFWVGFGNYASMAPLSFLCLLPPSILSTAISSAPTT